MVRLKEGDKIIRIDGLNVLASGYESCKNCFVVKDYRQNKPSYSLIDGWYEYDGKGAQSKGNSSSLIVTRNEGESNITLYYSAYVTPDHPKQRAMVNGIKVLDKEVRSSSMNKDEISIPSIIKDNLINFAFEFQAPTSLHAIGIGEDRMLFAIYLNRIKIH